MKTLAPIKADDFARIAAVLGPCELVEGEIVPLAPAGMEHSEVTMRILLALVAWNRQAKKGRVLTNEIGLVVKEDPDTVRGADVLFISYKRLPAAEKWKGFLRHKPELVVEILSADVSWKKMEEKVAEYHAFGVDLVWVADPQTQSVRLYPKGKASRVLHGQDELAGGHLLPGFRCKVVEFFVDKS